ncbi:hypothetical protein Tco_0783122 [Tanacetum coccineum]
MFDSSPLPALLQVAVSQPSHPSALQTPLPKFMAPSSSVFDHSVAYKLCDVKVVLAGFRYSLLITPLGPLHACAFDRNHAVARPSLGTLFAAYTAPRHQFFLPILRLRFDTTLLRREFLIQITKVPFLPLIYDCIAPSSLYTPHHSAASTSLPRSAPKQNHIPAYSQRVTATPNRSRDDYSWLKYCTLRGDISPENDNAIDEDVDEQPVQDLALNVDNVFQADDCDAYDSDVDEAPMAQTMFMANLSSADPDAICEHHEEHGMQDDVQPSYVVDSHADYTSDSNMTPYDQYVKDNAVPVAEALKSRTQTIKALTVKTCKKENLHKLGSLKAGKGLVLQQTKTCYIMEVQFHFSKLFHEHFAGIQKALTNDCSKKMSDAFDGWKLIDPKVIVDRIHEEIERKNLLIEHDNIIADGLSKEVFYVASNSELNVSKFTEMQKAHNVVKARCLNLSKSFLILRDNIQKG